MDLRRRRRGYSFIELSVILGILGVISVIGVVSLSLFSRTSDDESAKHTLRSVAAAEQLRYSQRGAFTDDPDDLAELDGGWTYVGPATAATSTSEVSASVGTHAQLDAVALTTATATECWATIVYPARLAEQVTARWSVADDACTGANAFERAGEQPW